MKQPVVLLPLLVLLVACAGGGPRDMNGEWAGTLSTLQGRCPVDAPSRLLVDGRAVSFVPGGGVLVLTGTTAPDTGRLHAQLLLRDMNHKPLPMVFEGAPSADNNRIDGTYGTPACRAHIVLVRPQRNRLGRALGN